MMTGWKMSRAIKYLQSYERLVNDAERLVDERTYLFNLAQGTKAIKLKPDKIQTSISGDMIGDAVARYVALDADIVKTFAKIAQARHDIEQTIRTVEDDRLSAVLYYRYIKLIPLFDVREYMRKSNGKRYSYQHIRRLHAEGVKAVEELINQKLDK